jgi:2-polyprenyl-6-methoxyphenol hydroxylase-like FAD-dependent oxidoreductase
VGAARGDGASDVLVVGAGPTGLTLAAQLRAFGTRVRIVDRQPDQAHESRALAVQPRTLEVLAGLGVADAMVGRGNPAVHLQLHARGCPTAVPLFDAGLDDSAYPFLLFLSQATTEALLAGHLTERGVTVERGVALTGLTQGPDRVTATLVHDDGRVEQVRARYVVGCDGAHSTVRDRAGIEFAGRAYPQTFVLADLDADGLEPGLVHVYLSGAGMLFFFPLDHPAAWRLLGWPPSPVAPERDAPSLPELEALAAAYAVDAPRLHEPVWATYFRLQHRHATEYRARRIFLAGDAAHVHSPAGAQGMNTGIQDAVNLAWKLALVVDGTAGPGLLDTYQGERQPVGRDVLRFTDRAFTIATSTGALASFARVHVAPRLARFATRITVGRARGVRRLAQLAISYRASPAVEEGTPRLRHGPRAGDRLPDAPVAIDGERTTLHRALAGPRYHLLLSGPPHRWPAPHPGVLDSGYAGIVEELRLTREPGPGALHDVSGDAHQRLGLDRAAAAHHLVRPDGHIAYRAAGTDLTGLRDHLARWLPGAG